MLTYLTCLLQRQLQQGIYNSPPSSLDRRLCSLDFWHFQLNDYPAKPVERSARLVCFSFCFFKEDNIEHLDPE